jgi:MHS family alpha-ketoglutarate permease-like MFS transporter
MSSPVPAPSPESTADATTAEASRRSWRSVVVGAGIGNMLEWYDWNVYVIFTPFFASQFFNSRNPVSALLSTLAVFAVGFLMRPLGGIFFGWLTDRRGRRVALVACMVVTALGSLLIAIGPTFSSVGVLASLVLLVARLAQGFGVGGEIGASHTFLAESAPPAKRGLWSSSMYVSITAGTLLATLEAAAFQTILTREQMSAWGWRIPFVVGALLSVYAFWLRRNLTETAAFRAHQRERSPARESILRGVWQHRASALRVVGLTTGGTVLYYTWAVNATSYAISVHKINAREALWAGVLANLVFIAALPVWGALSDRWGRKPNLIVFAVGLGVLSFPLTWLVQSHAWQLAVAMSVALIFQAAAVSVLPAVYAELFPTRVRASGMAFPYSVAVALFGGTAPYLQTYFSSRGSGWAFTAYSIVLLAVTLAVALRTPETRGTKLH